MILCKMANESQGLGRFNYAAFRDKLSATQFVCGQDGPMKLRLDLLESFMQRSTRFSPKDFSEGLSKHQERLPGWLPRVSHLESATINR
jgi:hypothetical protein